MTLLLKHLIFCQTPTRLGTQPERTWTNLNKSGLELTFFSYVKRTTTTSPNFTLQEGIIGLYLREGERVGSRKVSGRCLEGVFFGTQIFSEIKFFQHQNFFRTQNFSGPKIFQTRPFFRTYILLEPKIFRAQIFSGH